MANCILRGLKWGYKRSKKHDMFKNSISMTYKGNETISTWFGTFATIGILSVSAFYFYILMMRMFQYSEVSWNQNQRPIDPETEVLNLNFTEMDLNLNWLVPKQLIGNAQQVMDLINLEIIFSGEDFRTRIMDWYGREESAGPDDHALHFIRFWTDIGAQRIRAVGHSEGHTTISFDISTCNYPPDPNDLTVTWPDNLSHILDYSIITFELQNYVVDLGSISSPIKNVSLVDTLTYKRGANQEYILEVTKNELFLEDSLVPIFLDGSFQTFYSYSLTKSGERPSDNFNDNPTDGSIVIYLKMNEQVPQYKRKVLNIFDVLGTVGGIFEILEVFLGSLVGIISYSMVKHEVKVSLKIADLRYQQIKKAYEKISSMSHQCAWNCSWSNNQEENNNHVNVLPQNSNQKAIGLDETELKADKDLNALNFESFKEELNCIEITYAIKELKQQVNYLLRKDRNFINECKTNKNLVLTETLKNRYTRPISLTGRSENYEAEEIESGLSPERRSPHRMYRRRILPNLKAENQVNPMSMNKSELAEEQKLVTPVLRLNSSFKRNAG